MNIANANSSGCVTMRNSINLLYINKVNDELWALRGL